MRKLTLLIILLCPGIAAAVTPQITVSASAVTLLGGNQTISITVSLMDPQQTGMMRIVNTNIIPPQIVSTVTPGSTATVGPIWGNDVIANAFGVVNSTYYKVSTFTVTNGIIASTPSLSAFYAFQGSGTVDLSTATPVAPSFMSGPSGNVVVPGTLTASQFIGTVSTGTAPLVVASTTVVPNLNAQLHGGLSAPASAIVGISDSQTLTNKTLTSPTITGPTTTGTDAGTETLQNKTLTSPAINTPTLDGTGAAHVATQVSAATNYGTALGSQTIIASMPSTGTVSILFLIVQVTAGVGCSAATNSVTVNPLTWTAPGGTVENINPSSNMGITGNGAIDSGASTFGSSAFTNNGIQGIVAKTGTAITYTTTSSLGSTGCSTVPQYAIYAKAIF